MDNAPNDTKLLSGFFQENSEKFEAILLQEAVNVKDKIDEILTIGNIDLVNNAHKLVVYIIEGNEKELRAFAKQEGIAWASQSIALSFKLEWIQAIRRTLWNIIQTYHNAQSKHIFNDFFSLEQQINNRVDSFLNTFFISYSTYKDTLIKAQKELVENLSVPIIPINSYVSILPLIGSIDKSRTEIIEEKVLDEIGLSRIQTLIIDLSGIAEMEDEVAVDFKKIIDGSSMMGCETVITGLRKEVVQKITQLEISFGKDTKTLGTLQHALREFINS
ncbi:STAS domain-containing protein [Aquibacillus sediminis]|uniref:STAS domain-containing protein n=1 Tax=Aquibacillus sediminis TaxID=2574734 RepID=UPI001108AAA9|nr:STAS domain-containing protein [Aquibacillus sediminis]